MSKFTKISAVIAAIVITAFAGLIQLRFNEEFATAQAHFIADHHAESQSNGNKVTQSLRAVYENLRMLAVLPAVRNTKRHGENFSEEGLITFQQIYNNLANSVAVSEVYIVPVDFAPDRVDPITLKKEAPILMFDQLISDPGNGVALAQRRLQVPGSAAAKYDGPPQVEDFEYAQLTDQLRWLKTHYPDTSHINGIAVPMVSGEEIITCDNTNFVATGKDKDRQGIIFSVPFYDMEGQLKGLISATMLSSAVRDLLPAPGFALVNTTQHYAAEGTAIAQMGTSMELVRAGQVDNALIYSDAIPLPLPDGNSTWVLWAGAPNSAFWSSKDVADAYAERRDSGIVLLFASIASAVTFLMARRNLRQARILAITHERARIAAEKSEAEANRNAHQLQELNEHVSRLNNELSARLKDLHAAQEEIIKRGKMAQLGGLVATVAHEIRNPLASIRNTLFVIRRKFKDADVDATAQFERVESGILRCDNIISQLLDFSRSQQIECSLQDISQWLQTLLEEEASRADPAIAIKLVLPDTVVGVGFDPERLRRAVINIFNNACEAVKMRLDTQAGFLPSVCVSLAQTSRGIEICISDNGQGISKELLPRVGEPFFTSKSFGSGLGVAAATQVALLHGGGLDVSSTPGEGATFTIWLPTREVRVRAA